MRTLFPDKASGRHVGPDQVFPMADEVGQNVDPAKPAPSVNGQNAGDPATENTERQKAYEQGLAEGRAERDQAIEQALQNAVQQTRTIVDAKRDVREQSEADAERFVRSVLQAVVPSLAETALGYEIENAINDAIREAWPSDRVTVRMHPAVARVIRDRIPADDVVAGVDVQEDIALDRRQASVSWDGGGAEIDFARLWQRVRAVLDGLPEVMDADANFADAYDGASGEDATDMKQNEANGHGDEKEAAQNG